MKIKIGTRGSDLALWQAHHVAAQLFPEAEAEIVVIKTKGDAIDTAPLHKVEGKAFFTAEIEQALLGSQVDLAVHSHKDLPTETTPGLAIVAVPPRGPAVEWLVLRPAFHDPKAAYLPLVAEARVGTSAPRRAALLATLRPDLSVVDLRGNVPTRVNRLREGRYDAVLLAAAGLQRLELDLSNLVVVPLDLALAVPAPAQGALAVQIRAGDQQLAALCRRVLHDEPTAAAIAAERSLLARFGGGCHLALGAFVGAREGGKGFRAHLFVGADVLAPGRGARWSVGVGATPAAAAAAAEAAARAPGPAGGPLSGVRIALVGSADEGSALGARLEELGAGVFPERVLAFRDVGAPDLPAKLARLKRGDVLAVTSQEGARRLGGQRVPPGVVVAAVGPATAKALAAQGLPANVVGKGGARALADRLAVGPGSTVLFPCAEGARSDLPEALSARGAKVERVVLYRTESEAGSPAVADAHVRLYLSPSAVTASVALGRESGRGGRSVRVGLGGATCDALQDEGLEHERPKGSGPEAAVALLGRLFAGAATPPVPAGGAAP